MQNVDIKQQSVCFGSQNTQYTINLKALHKRKWTVYVLVTNSLQQPIYNSNKKNRSKNSWIALV